MQLAYCRREYNATRPDEAAKEMDTTSEDSRSQQSSVPPTERRWPGYDYTMYGDRRKPKVFDSTINIPTVMTFITMIVMVVGTGFGLYNAFDKRLTNLENSDREQEAHFVRLEAANREFKDDTKGSLNDIQSKVGQIRDWMISNGRVANRPDAQPWTRDK